MPRILARFGYRGVLISNTVILGLLILLFATIGVGTPVWLIVAQAFGFGFFTSLQYTSMNTLVYADVTDEQTSSASTIASTDAADVDELRRRRRLAGRGPLHPRSLSLRRRATDDRRRAQGVLVLGGVTILSAVVFLGLRNDDGAAVSQRPGQPLAAQEAAQFGETAPLETRLAPTLIIRARIAVLKTKETMPCTSVSRRIAGDEVFTSAVCAVQATTNAW